jgi:hypothetical protein
MQLHHFLAVTACHCAVYRLRLQNNACEEGVSKNNCDVTKKFSQDSSVAISRTLIYRLQSYCKRAGVITSSVQGRTDAGRQGVGVTEFCEVSPNICESSAWRSLYVIFMVPRILRRFVDLKKKMCISLLVAFLQTFDLNILKTMNFVSVQRKSVDWMQVENRTAWIQSLKYSQRHR